MKCVLITNGAITAISECSGLPTIPGWREAYPNEVYKIGDPIDLFDKRMRRRPVDATSMYGRATAEKQAATEQVQVARTAAESAKRERMEAEAVASRAANHADETACLAMEKIKAEKVAFERLAVAEHAALEKEQIVEAAAKALAQAASEEAAKQAMSEAERKLREEKAAQEQAEAERKAGEEAEKAQQVASQAETGKPAEEKAATDTTAKATGKKVK
jgi:hypothetical protein